MKRVQYFNMHDDNVTDDIKLLVKTIAYSQDLGQDSHITIDYGEMLEHPLDIDSLEPSLNSLLRRQYMLQEGSKEQSTITMVDLVEGFKNWVIGQGGNIDEPIHVKYWW